MLDGEEVDSKQSLIVFCEEFLVYSLLSNLLKNAVEASPQGENIAIEARLKDKSIVLCIHNEGVVPENIVDTFFDKYVTEGKSGGTGLGTYSAKLIAETMGGKISMSSSVDSGTAITIELPSVSVSEKTEDE